MGEKEEAGELRGNSWLLRGWDLCKVSKTKKAASGLGGKGLINFRSLACFIRNQGTTKKNLESSFYALVS